jgi:hypothetical protein
MLSENIFHTKDKINKIYLTVDIFLEYFILEIWRKGGRFS